MDLPPLSFHAILEDQWAEEEELEETETVLKVVPPAYPKYLDVFSKVKSEKLPPHRACDHHIDLGSFLPLVGVIYSLSNQESGTLWAYISENKKVGGLHLCLDYRKLNAVTRKNRYPVPRMNQLLTIFNSSTMLSKIDLHGAYNLLRMKERNKHLTSFKAKYGSYEYLGMPFGHTNTPASFQNLAGWPIYHMPCHAGTTCTQRGGGLHQQEPSKFSSRWKDKDYKEIRKKLARGESYSDYSLEPQAKLLLFKYRVVIPSNEEIQLNILQKHHDSPFTGHPGQEKTLNIIKRDFNWAGMSQFIKDYVLSCQRCSRNEKIHHKEFGLLKPLQIPSGPWNSLSMDFITQLPH
ncbi:hypothetical protein O181_034808 [Austropuccinia psidii MF-1]|uniref:Integrase zinc-binding domain-containing protein n=1 Tax=Austropuccinia psidii MF-1 TaxID=1389203 RepID=A0A9Q3D492_9BASI|nr:hypothetical protein [Austropuccinia psidii MF-1]